jgi:hypothetical protein
MLFPRAKSLPKVCTWSPCRANALQMGAQFLQHKFKTNPTTRNFQVLEITWSWSGVIISWWSLANSPDSVQMFEVAGDVNWDHLWLALSRRRSGGGNGIWRTDSGDGVHDEPSSRHIPQGPRAEGREWQCPLGPKTCRPWR